MIVLSFKNFNNTKDILNILQNLRAMHVFFTSIWKVLNFNNKQEAFS